MEDEGENSSNGGGDSSDSLWWFKDFGYHHSGEFSMAIIQANVILEDQCHLESGSMSLNESGPFGTFVGVYDGHGGPEAARFIRDRLFENIKSTFIALSKGFLFLL